MAQHLEIERKFLLKKLPNINPVDIIKIEQFYMKNLSDIWERARSWSDCNGNTKYIHTIKKNISNGVNMEDEKLITELEFIDFKDKCLNTEIESKYINKVRYIYSDGDLFWEVDEFLNDYKLIIAEVELPRKKFNLIIPDFISEVLLLEVTNFKQFNNRNLSLDIKNKKNTESIGVDYDN